LSFSRGAYRALVEQRFLSTLNEKMKAENTVRMLHDELMRLQGELRCLDAIPDDPPGAG